MATVTIDTRLKRAIDKWLAAKADIVAHPLFVKRLAENMDVLQKEKEVGKAKDTVA